MDAPLEKFQALLRELFQFDCQDLDFGIYRVLNLKRAEIEKFIGERLPQIVDEAFAAYASADQREMERELEEKRKEIEETASKLGQQAFEPSGQLVFAIRETPLGKQFIELETRAKAGRVADELKISVYNDLYSFFSRYYDDGDIFSKPRRGRVEIPFTGHEDVVLYWANKDQYYIKTGEQFKNYRFKIDSFTVEFALCDVAAQQNNNQREKRYYVLAGKSPLTWDDKAKTLSIFFEYRPLTEKEKKTYGKTETQKPQEKLNEDDEQRILKSNGAKLPPEVKARLAQSSGEDKPSLLRQHLTRFTRKNTTDFFIHKNLRGFLTGELDDFIKTEVLHAHELLAMENRIAVSVQMLDRTGAFLCHIDENEYENLHILCSELGIPDGGTVVWDKKNPMLGRKGVATQHEYILWRTWEDSPVYLRAKNIESILAQAKALVRKHGGVNEKSRREFAQWMRRCQGLSGGERAYRLLDDDGRVFRGVAMGAPEPRTDPKFHIPLVHPVKKKKCPVPPNGWSRAPETLKELMAKDEILFGEDETVQPQRKIFLTEESQRQLASVVSDSSRGKNDLETLGLDFPYCHPVSLYEELTGACANENGDVVLDYFAGSGTTAHAVMNLNRDDGEERKYVLVEVDDQFDTVMVPRIKKVAFSNNWRDGKPSDGKAVAQFVKYHLFEQYEDALNNLELPRAAEGELALKQFGDEYLLRYMLNFETAGSASLLALEQMAHPFSYKLKVQEGDTMAERVVDVVETFNYLLGLEVKKLRQFRDGDRLYRAVLGEQRNQKIAVVIWRDLDGLEENAEALRRDAEFIEKEILPTLVGEKNKPDRLVVNGPCVLDGAEAIEAEFHRLMFAPIA